jgi:hypothetical protein
MISRISVFTVFIFGFVLSFELGSIKKVSIRGEAIVEPILQHCDFAIRWNSSNRVRLGRETHFHRRITRHSTPKHFLRSSASEIVAILSDYWEDQNIAAQTQSTRWRLTCKHCRLIPLCSSWRSRIGQESAGSLGQRQNRAYHITFLSECWIWYENVVIKCAAWFEQRWRSASDWRGGMEGSDHRRQMMWYGQEPTNLPQNIIFHMIWRAGLNGRWCSWRVWVFKRSWIRRIGYFCWI